MKARAGVVIYRRLGRTLVGEWTHEDVDGQLVLEVVFDVPEGEVEGDWPVKIFLPADELNWAGRVKSTKLGAGLKLEWTGEYKSGPNAGERADFVGVGIVVDPDTIVACFEPVETEC